MTTLKKRAAALRLHGLLANWNEIADADWLSGLIEREEQERHTRSLGRRQSAAHIAPFKPIADFDWDWPQQIDRRAIETLLRLDFIPRGGNAVLVGGSGTGKTMIAANIAHQAVLGGHTVRFEATAKLLDRLAAIEVSAQLHHQLTLLVRPQLLILDEIGYLTHDTRHADLLFHIVSRRHQRRSTVITTSRTFAEWGQIFSDAGCLVGLIDRLIHDAAIIAIDGESWRLRESRQNRTEPS